MTRFPLAAVLLWSSTGCAVMLADIGRDSDVVANGVARDRVVAALGPPAMICPKTSEKACWNEVYSVFGKYPDDQRKLAYGEWDIATAFLSEAVFTPVELVHTGYASVSHGSLVVMYCPFNGETSGVVDHYEQFTSTDVDLIAGMVCRPEDAVVDLSGRLRKY